MYQFVGNAMECRFQVWEFKFILENFWKIELANTAFNLVVVKG